MDDLRPRGRRATNDGLCTVCKSRKKDGTVVPKRHKEGICEHDRMPVSCGVNKKVGADTVIFNICAATYCPSVASTVQPFFERVEVEAMTKHEKIKINALLPEWVGRTRTRRVPRWELWLVAREIRDKSGKQVTVVTRYTSEKLARESEDARAGGAVRLASDADLCEVGRDNCYAINTEKNRPNTKYYRIRQEFMWDNLTAREIADDLEEALNTYYLDGEVRLTPKEYFTEEVKSVTGKGTTWKSRFQTHPYIVCDGDKTKGWKFVRVTSNSRVVGPGLNFTFELPDGRKEVVVWNGDVSNPPALPRTVAAFVLSKGKDVMSAVKTRPDVKPGFVRFSESGDVRDEEDVKKLAEVFRLLQEEMPHIRVYGYTARRDIKGWGAMPSNTVVNGSGCLADFQSAGVHNSFIATFVERGPTELYCEEDCRNCGLETKYVPDEYRKWEVQHRGKKRKKCAIPHGRAVYIMFHGAGAKSKLAKAAREYR